MPNYCIIFIFEISALIISVISQSTSHTSYNCVYTFHVPKNELGNTCAKQTLSEDLESMKKRLGLDILESIVKNQQQQLANQQQQLANQQQQLAQYNDTIKKQQHETATSNQQQQCATQQQQLAQFNETIKNQQQQLAQSSATITNQQQQLTLMSTTLNKYLTEGPDVKHSSIGNQSVGTNYIRYGHKSCPDTASLVYEGFTGKSNYHPSHPGGGNNHLCLPRNPEWPTGSTAGYQSGSYIYGVEYEFQNSPVMPSSKHDNDVPCAVCEVVGRSQKMMIPAKKTCPDGWTKEYEGILMAEYYTHTKSDFVCVDLAMQTIIGGHENKNGGLLYVVEAVCGSLPCPPYIDGYEIACIVCSK